MKKLIAAMAVVPMIAMAIIQANAQVTETWECHHARTGDGMMTLQVDRTPVSPTAMVEIPMYSPAQAACDNCTPPIITWRWDMGQNACGRLEILTDDFIGIYDKLECGTPRKLERTLHLVCEMQTEQ